MRTLTLVALAAALTTAGCRRSDHKGSGGRTLIQNKGSDTLVNIAQAWAERYREVDPNVAVAVSGGGSGTGIAAIINGTVDIANASREIGPQEAAAARKNTGKDPVQHVVAKDALAVVVHSANPLAGVDRTKLACVYGKEGTCVRWSDLGVEVPGCSGQEIIRVSRQNNSGTYHYFREVVLGKKDFRLGSRDLNGSKDVVDLVGQTPCAIGYTGMGYLTAEVKALCITPEGGGECVMPTLKNVVAGTYPIARDLYMYTLGPATGAVATYLDWVRSEPGQRLVSQLGYIPVPKERQGE